jgi:hypothetical protein
VPSKRCVGRTVEGRACNATPRQSGLCLWHDPDLEEERSAARKLGGQRRKREVTIFAAHDFENLESIAGIRRVLEIVVADLLAKEGTVPRDRALISAAQVAITLLEKGEHADQLEDLLSVLRSRPQEKGKNR